MKTLLRVMLVTLLSALLAACAATSALVQKRSDALTSYEVAVRWNEFDEARAHLDPALGIVTTDLERERYKQIQVTGYEVKSRTPITDSGIEQTVEIRVVNRHTQIERIITDRQRWRWDATLKRHWLVSGLPDFSTQ